MELLGGESETTESGVSSSSFCRFVPTLIRESMFPVETSEDVNLRGIECTFHKRYLEPRHCLSFEA